MTMTTLNIGGTEITTTATLTDVIHALQSHVVSDHPLLPSVRPEPTPTPEPKAVATKVARAATKSPGSRRTKSDGKALWAEITSLVAEGQYDEARQAASVKPDTFGVQCEAAIARREAKPKAGTHKERPMADSPVLDKVIPEPAPKERRAAKRAAKAQQAQRQAKPRNHKPDCGCVTCPAGVARRKEAAKPQPKVKVLPEGKATRKARAAYEAPKPQPKAPQVDKPIPTPERVRSVASETLGTYLEALDLEALTLASRAYLAQTKRQERLGNQALAEAYADALDDADAAIALVKEAAATKA